MDITNKLSKHLWNLSSKSLRKRCCCMLLCYIALHVNVLTAYAQTPNHSFVSVGFPQNRCSVAPTKELDSMIHVLKRMRNVSTIRIKQIWIDGSASPEGRLEYNRKLGLCRASTLASYLKMNAGVPDSLLKVKNLGEDWLSVKMALEKNSSILARDRVVGIIDAEVDYERRKREIKAIDEGRTWAQLYREVFPKLRNARVMVVSAMEGLPEVIPLELPVERMDEEEKKIKEMYFARTTQLSRTRKVAVKVNLMPMAALIANVGVEMELCPQWSIDIPVWYSPYNLFGRNRKIRLLAVQPEIRWWTKSVMDGHFVGLHTHVAGFNIALNDHLRFQDPNVPLWGVGGSYGYAKPLGKKNRWGIEFNLGLGFAKYKYDAYRNWQDGPKLESGEGVYWGITRVGVTISYKWVKHTLIKRRNDEKY